MIDHMRTTEAPAFVNADSAAVASPGEEPPAVAPRGSNTAPKPAPRPQRTGRNYKP
jgi:hypothetical protein